MVVQSKMKPVIACAVLFMGANADKSEQVLTTIHEKEKNEMDSRQKEVQGSAIEMDDMKKQYQREMEDPTLVEIENEGQEELTSEELEKLEEEMKKFEEQMRAAQLKRKQIEEMGDKFLEIVETEVKTIENAEKQIESVLKEKAEALKEGLLKNELNCDENDQGLECTIDRIFKEFQKCKESYADQTEGIKETCIQKKKEEAMKTYKKLGEKVVDYEKKLAQDGAIKQSQSEIDATSKAASKKIIDAMKTGNSSENKAVRALNKMYEGLKKKCGDKETAVHQAEKEWKNQRTMSEGNYHKNYQKKKLDEAKAAFDECVSTHKEKALADALTAFEKSNRRGRRA